jgi:TPR repeat protein
LGAAAAHRALSGMYYVGQGVTKDTKMSIYHAEEAAMLGCPDSRYDLGVYYVKKGKYDKAKKHFIMLANIGYDGSLKWRKELYVDGKASKEDYAGALRAYQAAVNAAKSREREEANSLHNAREAAQKKS